MPYFAMNKSAAISLLQHFTGSIDEAIGQYGSFNKESVIAKLNEIYDKAETKALQVYNFLGYTGDIQSIEQQLNEEIQLLQDETKQLNGLDLEKCFLEVFDKVTSFEVDAQLDFDQFVKQCEIKIIDIKDKVINKRTDLLWTVIWNELSQEVLNSKKNKKKISVSKDTFGINFQEVGIDKNGLLYYTKTGYKIGKINEVLSLCNQDIQKGFINYWDKKKKEAEEKKITFQNNSTINGASLYSSFDFTHNKAEKVVSFLKMKKDEREKLFIGEEGFQFKQKIITLYKEEILNQCNITGKHKKYLELAIDKAVLPKMGGSIDAFFGATKKGMTGLLGEIQAMFYIFSLTRGKIINNVDWVGGINNPHTDIMLNDLNNKLNFGIQVKNTSSELGAEKEIEFQSFNMSSNSIKHHSFLDNGELIKGIYNFQNTENAWDEFENMGLPIPLSQSIQTILSMYTFNREYIYKKTINSKGKEWNKAVLGDNEEFSEVRNTIEDYAKKCQQIMSAFSYAMMYMQYDNNSDANSNILYVVAGKTIVSAATILIKIIKELKNEINSFSMMMRTSSTLSGLDQQYNITDVINGTKKISSLDFTFQSSYTFV